MAQGEREWCRWCPLAEQRSPLEKSLSAVTPTPITAKWSAGPGSGPKPSDRAITCQQAAGEEAGEPALTRP